ncbi:type II toxin-antitoxin system Phd/YefM family antitoxin [Nocardia flavorosea]|uniref:Type II toxin-antitoxin system prevent-host-death family antitoxin n=1 Tax=Nocardia flavorosea TaxID=53429 RepID=A0A846YG08_9NOCA|nr:type II toxin-antitoxin system prevent-host-death family antitoxin [Nocardia flavorosea]NKY56660.1 type II toxin-antitoxin system prevent-host-death family antitoxin [Nocardia flavorosea]
MATMSAAEASRNFSAVLSRAEHGETIRIVRHGRTVATVTPPATSTGRSLRLALEESDIAPFDDDFASDIAAGLAMVSDEMEDPWAGA